MFIKDRFSGCKIKRFVFG